MEKSETACIPLPNRGKCNFKEMMKNQGVGGGGEVGGGGGGELKEDNWTQIKTEEFSRKTVYYS